MQAALALLGTLRATGTSAIVVVDEYGSTEDKDHFIRFSARLEQGDIVSCFFAAEAQRCQNFLVCSRRRGSNTGILFIYRHSRISKVERTDSSSQ